MLIPTVPYHRRRRGSGSSYGVSQSGLGQGVGQAGLRHGAGMAQAWLRHGECTRSASFWPSHEVRYTPRSDVR